MCLANRPQHSLFVSLLLAAVTLTSLGEARGAEADPASLLPPDTVFYVLVPNVSATKERFKNTSLWALYKEPAMQQFVGPAEKAIREKMDEKLRELWKELDLDVPPKDLPWPTGRVVVAIRMGIETRSFPKYDWNDESKGPPKITGMQEIKVPAPQFVGILDMGENADALKEIVAQLTEKAVEKGFRRLRETVRGIEMEVFIPPPPKRPEGMPEGMLYNPPLGQAVCYSFNGETALISNNQDLLSGVLVRLSGGEAESLVDNAARKDILRRIGAPGDVTFYFNIGALVEFVRSMAPAEEREKMDRVLHALGVDNVLGLGMEMQIAPNDNHNLVIKGLLTVRGEKRGIPALLTPDSNSTVGNRLLTKGLASFLVANYEFGTFYERIRQMVLAAGGPDINMQVQQMMAMTAMNDPDGRPPIDLQREVLGQFAAPLVIRARADKPYADHNASKTMVSLGALDRDVLETALGRIHETLVAQGNPELRRELLDTNIFLLPAGGGILSMMLGMSGAEGAAQQEPLAFAVPGNNFVIGRISGVEQEIRNLRREELLSIQSDSMYRHAASALPAQAGIWFYENQQISAEVLWSRLKKTARKVTEKPADAEDQEFSAYMQLSLPGSELIKQLKKVCDFNLLPDFQIVKQHFGASVGYVKGIDDGIYFQAVCLKAPPGESD